MPLLKFAVFYKVNLHDASAELALIGLQNLTVNTDNMAHITLQNNRSILLGSIDAIRTLKKTLSKDDVGLSTDQDWHMYNIEEKIPAVYPETSGKFLPHELNLPELNAVHFAKGCYTGQEIIARMHYRGKLKTHLFKAMLTNANLPVPGTTIYSSQENTSRAVGTVVDACQKGYNNYLVLLVTDEINAKDKHLFIHKNDNFFTF